MNWKVRRVIEDVDQGQVTEATQRLAHEILHPGATPTKAPILSVVTADTRRANAKRDEALAKATMRAEVFAWNIHYWSNAPGLFYPHGRCDNPDCGLPFAHRGEGECDHWIERSLGGEHTRINGWRLCTRCHRAKGAADPSREIWNLRRKRYCKLAEIPFVPRKVKP